MTISFQIKRSNKAEVLGAVVEKLFHSIESEPDHEQRARFAVMSNVIDVVNLLDSSADKDVEVVVGGTLSSNEGVTAFASAGCQAWLVNRETAQCPQCNGTGSFREPYSRSAEPCVKCASAQSASNT